MLKPDGDVKTKLLMVIGEGSIFLILLIAGVYKIRSSFKKEINLAKQQNNFLLSITHELKSPLASIKLQIETLLKRDLDEASKGNLFSKILIDANRLNELVDNVLLASRINDESFVMERQDQNIVPMLADIVEKFAKSNEGNHAISFSSEPKEIVMAIDVMAFPGIVTNLIENSMKYSDEGSGIDVELKQDGNKITLLVKDEGDGINDENKDKVFEKFFRVDDELRRKTKGTGLGLYIVNYLVTKHNGTIEIKDNSPKGSVFEIIFYKK